MPELVAVEAHGDAAFVRTLLQVWDAGDAVLPVDPRLAGPARATLLDAMAPARVLTVDGEVVARRHGEPTEVGDALVTPTSGSTGVPKGVVHTHTSITAAARSVNEALAVDAGRDAWLCCLPLGHVAGLAVLVRAFEAGCPVEVIAGFDPDLVRDAPDRHGVTLTSLVPTALARTDVTGYRAVLVGGAAPHGTLPPNVRVSYGMTETFGAVTVDGRPVPGAELAVRDGEVLVRSTALGRTYRGAGPVADADGWFHTGDAGELDATGRLVVHGRRGEMIITGGENVWPAPVEAILAGVSGVAEVAVVGRADPTWGQAVTAVVVPADPRHPPALDELRDAVKEQLAAFAAPRRLELVARLPRTSLGKLRRSALVDPT